MLEGSIRGIAGLALQVLSKTQGETSCSSCGEWIMWHAWCLLGLNNESDQEPQRFPLSIPFFSNKQRHGNVAGL